MTFNVFSSSYGLGDLIEWNVNGAQGFGRIEKVIFDGTDAGRKTREVYFQVNTLPSENLISEKDVLCSYIRESKFLGSVPPEATNV